MEVDRTGAGLRVAVVINPWSCSPDVPHLRASYWFQTGNQHLRPELRDLPDWKPAVTGHLSVTRLLLT